MEPVTPNEKPILSVTEISLSLKACVEQVFSAIRVRGEVSGVKKAPSGHIYFSLKDKDSVLSAVAWRGRSQATQNAITEGLEVICSGKLSTYPGRSNYQMIVETAEPAGQGALLKLLNDRREKLQKEGLFDQARKKKIPYLPEVIGVITSPTGAVIRDIMHRLTDRFGRHVLLWPVLVQGETAADQITAAIQGFNKIPIEGLDVPYTPAKSKHTISDTTVQSPLDAPPAEPETFEILSEVKNESASATQTTVTVDISVSDTLTSATVLPQDSHRATDITFSSKAPQSKPGFIHLPRPDLLIVARGGGSLEDLWPFNEENVVRAAANSDIPLISAVGHETDTTLIDYASDLRAPTPTAAAELAVPVKFELAAKISNADMRLNEGVLRYLSEKQMKIENLSKSIPNLGELINLFIQKLDDRFERFQISIKNYIKNKENQFVNLKNLLKSYSFEAVLERGFSLVTDNHGKIVASARLAQTLNQIKISFFDGKVDARVIDPSDKSDTGNTSAVPGGFHDSSRPMNPSTPTDISTASTNTPFQSDPTDTRASLMPSRTPPTNPISANTSAPSTTPARKRKTKQPDPNQKGLFDDI